jgi:phage FluMu gp28-like protein
MPIEISLYRPIPWQREVIDAPGRFKVLAIGRRAGKSELLKHQAVTPETLPYPVGWFSPTYKDMGEVWRDLANRLAPIIVRQNATERRMDFVTGGSLEFWSLTDVEAGRGRKYKRVLIDEAAFVARLWDSWNYAIRSTLADLRGDAYIASTPKGRNGFWRMWQMGRDELDGEWACWQMPSEVGPAPPDELASMRRTLPERVAAQELDAAFLDDAGGVFRRVIEAATAATRDDGLLGRQYAFGVDWAYSNDYTAVAVVDMGTKELVALERWNGVDYTLQRERIMGMAKRFRPIVVVSEANAMGRPNNEALRAAGLNVVDFTTTSGSKTAIIGSLASALERGDIRIIPDTTLISELQAYEGERTPTGTVRYGAPDGMHDDTVIALALAWYGATDGAGRQIEMVNYIGGKR